MRQIVTNWYFSTLWDYKGAPVGHLHGAGVENEGGGVTQTKRLWEISYQRQTGSDHTSKHKPTAVALENTLL